MLAAGGAAAAAAPLLSALGQICAGLSDAAEQRETEALHNMEVDGAEAAAAAAAAQAPSSSYAAAAEAALGSALQHLGPEVVLRVLPLDLQQGLSGAGEARTWLLPALRRHVSGTQLRYWAAHLMPLAKEMGQAAGAASQRGNKVMVCCCLFGCWLLPLTSVPLVLLRVFEWCCAATAFQPKPAVAPPCCRIRLRKGFDATVHLESAQTSTHVSLYVCVSVCLNTFLPHLCVASAKGLAAACHALEVQLWSCLQAFASWPTDAAEVYPGEFTARVQGSVFDSS